MEFFTNKLSIVLLFFTYTATAQIEGLWEVKKVMVGDQLLTPTAKWFDLKANKQVESGNGGITNLEGSWDLTGEILTFKNAQGVTDPYGSFTIGVQNKDMTWSRKEDGRMVTINLSKSDQKPKAPWDKIVGYWVLEKVLRGTEDVTAYYNTDNDRFIFIRWDRRFNSNYVGEKKDDHRGFWHIESHSPYLRLFSGKGDLYDTNWDISFNDQGKMTWENPNTEERWQFALRIN